MPKPTLDPLNFTYDSKYNSEFLPSVRTTKSVGTRTSRKGPRKQGKEFSLDLNQNVSHLSS